MWVEVIVKDADKEIKLSLPCEEQELKDSYTVVSCRGSWQHISEESLTLKELNKLAQQLQDVEDAFEDEKLAAYIDATNCDLKLAVNKYEKAFFYHDMDLEDVAECLIEECENLPEGAKDFFDYKAFAEYLGNNGYYETFYGTIVIKE